MEKHKKTYNTLSKVIFFLPKTIRAFLQYTLIYNILYVKVRPINEVKGGIINRIIFLSLGFPHRHQHWEDSGVMRQEFMGQE